MAQLDCETVDSTYSSLERILGIDRVALNLRLDEFKNCDQEPMGENPQNLILDFITGCNQDHILHDSTCWFHATRTHDPNGFKQGLFPTSLMLDAIWSFLFSLVADQISQNEWQQFRSQTEADFYGLGKMTFEAKRKYEQGPYGLLIRNNVFCRCDMGHDYLQTPELVEDICRCFKPQFRFDLQRIFFAKTKPCLVKFVSTPRDREEIGHALLFLLHRRGNCSNSRFDDWCFIGDGQPVLPANIMAVEWPAML